MAEQEDPGVGSTVNGLKVLAIEVAAGHSNRTRRFATVQCTRCSHVFRDQFSEIRKGTTVCLPCKQRGW